MNIWALDKDIDIKHLLLMLEEQFEDGGYTIVNNPGDGQQAVRLMSPTAGDVQLYVFTYGQQKDHYGVHIEYPDLQETNYRDTVETHDNISFDALVSLMVTNLELSITRRVE